MILIYRIRAESAVDGYGLESRIYTISVRIIIGRVFAYEKIGECVMIKEVRIIGPQGQVRYLNVDDVQHARIEKKVEAAEGWSIEVMRERDL